MQFLSVAFFAALASAHFLPGFDGKYNPAGLIQCGQQCYTANVAAAIGCDPLDMMALCVNEPFHKVMLPCLIATCSIQELKETFEWVQPRCEASFEIFKKKSKAELKAAFQLAEQNAQAKGQ